MKRRVVRHEVTQPLDPLYRYIPLTQNQNAIVDTEDCEWLNQWNWHAHWSECTKSFYALRTVHYKDGTCEQFRMHRVIMECGPEEETDHKNHDTLDNRRLNLRKCTREQNMVNRSLRKDNTSGFTGVTKYLNKWKAELRIKGRERINLGIFSTPEEAAKAYDAARKEHFGEFSRPNIPRARSSQALPGAS